MQAGNLIAHLQSQLYLPTRQGTGKFLPLPVSPEVFRVSPHDYTMKQRQC